MSRQTSVLDGPKMGYGPPPQEHSRGMRLSTVILVLVCVLLAGLLALALVGRHQAITTSGPTAPPSAAATVSPSPGAVQATNAFVGAWSLAPADRDDTLAAVAATGLPDAVDEATAARLARGEPSGVAGFVEITEKSLLADQPLSDGSTVRMQLAFDQAAVYGWLVTSVELR